MISRGWCPKIALALSGALLLTLALAATLAAQVIEYEANGSKYQTLSRQGLTVIITHLPNHVAGFGLDSGLYRQRFGVLLDGTPGRFHL